MFTRSRVLAGVLIPALLGCVDATHEDQVKALGGETPGVSPGPLHRPGQPCLTCHGGEGPAHAQFSVAGTVYAVRSQSTPAVGAEVQIEDITGFIDTATTNTVGNFFIRSDDWAPTYPTQMQVALGSLTQQMTTHVGREGSCAGCHVAPQGPTSPGAVFVAATASDLPEGGL
jgi:hypothetical protein